MKRLAPLVFLVCAGCLGRPVVPAAVEEVSGVVTADRTLSGNVLMTGDLLVPAGRTLTIAPGSRILVRASESTKIDPEYLAASTELTVRGRLIVDGTAAAPVTFAAEKRGAPGEVRWSGILLDRGAAAEIRYARISDAEHGVLAMDATSQISHSTIDNCRYGVVLQGGGESWLRNNTISANEGGIFVWNGAAPRLEANRVTGQIEEGLFVDRLSRPQLIDNRIDANGVGLVLSGGDCTAGSNRIEKNRIDLFCPEPR